MASCGFRISLIIIKNMKCPAYANTGFVIEKKASKKDDDRVILISLPG